MSDHEFAPVEPRTVQDDAREQQMAALLNLNRASTRTGSDARDEHGNRYELKTTTTASVTTARDVGPDYLDRIGMSYLIAARGRNTDFGFTIDEMYFLSPEMLAEWISTVEARLSGDRTLVDSAIGSLVAASFEGDLDRLRYLGYRGMTINNPKIPWSYVTSHGIRIEGQPALALRELIARFPIDPRAT